MIISVTLVTRMRLNFLKKYLCTYLLFILFNHGTLSAQENKVKNENAIGQVMIHLQGSIVDDLGRPFPYVSIVLIRNTDSTTSKGTITNEMGVFTLNVNEKPGQYILVATDLKSKTFLKSLAINKLSRDTSIEIAPITLKVSYKTLGDITVRNKKPLLVRDLDKLVFDVSGSVLSSGYNALEILGKLPGVITDANGSVSINGSSSLYILIDGNGQYMTKEQVQSLLKNLRSENVDKIEIITNPSSKYDAQGGAVINIVTKKDHMKSDLHVTYGNQLFPVKDVNGFSYPFFETGGTLNYKFSKVKTYIRFNISSDQEYRNNLSELLQIPAQDLQRQNQEIITYRETGLSYGAGVNYDINKRNTMDFQFNSFGSLLKHYYSTNSNYYGPINSQGQPFDSTYVFSGTNKFDNNRFNSAIVKYTHSINTNGMNISATIDFSSFNSPNDQNYMGNFTYLLTPIVNKDSFVLNKAYNVHIYSEKIDYTWPVTKTTTIEAGVKLSSIRHIDNSQTTYNLKQYDSTLENEAQVNTFNYNETIFGFYLNLKKSINKFKFEFGLRGENTSSKGSTSSPVISSVSRNYFNIFPSANLQFDLNENNHLGLSYSLRIIRPSYSDFDPNTNYFSPLLSVQGSYNLDPQLLNKLELSYIFKNYFISFTFTRAGNPRIDLPQENQNSGVTIANYVTNLKRNDNFYVTLNIPVTVSKWWQIYSNLSLSNTSSILLDSQVTSNWFYNFSINQTFSLGASNRIESNFYYNSGYAYAYSITKSNCNLSLGYRYFFQKDKFNLTFNINDILGTDKFRTSSNYGYLMSDLSSSKNNRSIRLSLVYKFNTGNIFSMRPTSSKNDFGEKRY